MDIESYLILKYGSVNKAYHVWINSPLDSETMPAEEFNIINKFFAEVSLRDRLVRQGKSIPYVNR